METLILYEYQIMVCLDRHTINNRSKRRKRVCFVQDAGLRLEMKMNSVRNVGIH